MGLYSLKDDWEFLDEAKEQYQRQYGKEIEKLGYILGTGIACNPVVGIAARIFGEDTSSDCLQTKIKSMLPATFMYQGEAIPVDLRIIGRVVPAKKQKP